MNRYRVMLPLRVHTEDASYTQGEEFEKEFSVEDERENLNSGLLEIVPSEWKVTGNSQVFETAPGETFVAPLTLGQQETLMAGGHIEPVTQKKTPKKKEK